MALDLTQLQAATDDLWLNTDPIDIKFTDNPLCYMLLKQAAKADFDEYFVKASETVDGGKKIKVPLEYDDSNAGSYGKTTVIPQSKVDIINAAMFPWGGLYASNALGLDDQVQNSGAEAVVDLAYRYIQNILKTAWQTLATNMFTRTSGDDDAIKALSDLFDTTGSTEYGGIAEDDMSLWKANVNTDGSAISFEFLQKLWRTPAIGQSRKKRPNLGITTELLKDGYERTLQTQQRFSDQKMVEAGFDNVLHKGAPIVADDNVSSGYFYALNTNYLKLKAHKDYNFTNPEWIAKKESGQPDNIFANTRWVGQLVCTHRKAHILATGVTEPS
ncbi:MAG: phage major capsid protein [Candidatus Omnitrophica bacterium]|jgi:hypothetical protein|nr:phage major capsid protein [Candidatus Omnitrophota bacterium]